MDFRETAVAGADEGRPGWYVPPVGGEFVETAHSADLHTRISSLSRSERRDRFAQVQAERDGDDSAADSADG